MRIDMPTSWGLMVTFLQNHVQVITEDPELVSQNVYKYYNENMADVKEKTLYLVEEELASDLSTEAKIRAVYPYEVQIVDREKIKELIMAGG